MSRHYQYQTINTMMNLNKYNIKNTLTELNLNSVEGYSGKITSNIIEEINKKQQREEKINQNSIVIIKIYSETCPYCDKVVNEFIKLANKYSSNGVLFLQEKGSSCNLDGIANKPSGVPAFLIYKDGKEVDRTVGANLSSLETKIQKLLKN